MKEWAIKYLVGFKEWMNEWEKKEEYLGDGNKGMKKIMNQWMNDNKKNTL